MKEQLALLDVPRSAPSRRSKLADFKRAHGILTHRSKMLSPGERPWCALIPLDEDKGKDVLTIMSESCRLYEEGGLIGLGEGELSAVRELCRLRGIACDV